MIRGTGLGSTVDMIPEPWAVPPRLNIGLLNILYTIYLPNKLPKPYTVAAPERAELKGLADPCPCC